MRVLLVGSGGREHALAWKLAQSDALDELHAAPGNPGIAALGQCHPVRADDLQGLLDLAYSLDADLAVIGPEAPLVAGAADELRRAGIAVFGPSAAAARIEGSKAFAKEVLAAAGVPAARAVEPRAPCVVKADGLAAGKGVFVCTTQPEVEEALVAARALGDTVVVEELLEGEELSVFVLSDGENALALAEARDFKRAGDGDTGPNTGGMGSYSPVPDVDAGVVEEIVESVHMPVLRELASRGAPFVGVLFAGLMLTRDGPRVLEFNCRFGDPETQSILPRIDGDLLEVLAAAAHGDVSGVELETTSRAAVTVVIAGGSYPSESDSGTAIEGVDAAERAGAIVFHAGTARRNGRLVTNGGRILNVVGVGDDLATARRRAYEGVAAITIDGARCRTDIALTAAEAARVG